MIERLSIADYNNLSNIPIVHQDLDDIGFTPVNKTYYMHTGVSEVNFTIGAVYYFDNSAYNIIDGKVVAGIKGSAESSYRQGYVEITKANIGLSNVTNAAQIPLTDKGAANGVASLDTNGKVPLSQINDTVLGQVEYLGQWDASIGVFEGTDLRSPVDRAYRKGDYYICAVGGNKVPKLDGTSGYIESTLWTYAVGDWLIFGKGNDDTAWGKVDNTDAVSSVCGKVGVVVLNKSDVGLGNVDNTADANKSVADAAKLTNARTIELTGDANASVSFDGSANVSGVVTLADSGVISGTYSAVQVDNKGRAIQGGDIMEFGVAGQTEPSSTLVINGIFLEMC